MPHVSLLIVSYNNASTIRECLLGLNDQTFPNFEVVLIDNASSDNTREMIEAIRPLLRYPFRGTFGNENLGFAGGNNAALRTARGPLVALLNPDAVPERHWLEELVHAMAADAGIGICASKIIADGAEIIDSAGDGYSRSLRGYKRGEGQPKSRFEQHGFVFGACACAALYRRNMVDDIGFLDGQLFLIHEDTDLNLRAQLMGWKAVYVPSAVVRHKVRSSIGAMSDTAVYYSLRNAEIVRLKNIPFGVFLRCLPAVTIQLVAEFLYFAIKKKRLSIYLRAKRDFLRSLPVTLRERSRLMKAKKVENKYLYQMMTSVFQPEFLKEKWKKFASC